MHKQARLALAISIVLAVVMPLKVEAAVEPEPLEVLERALQTQPKDVVLLEIMLMEQRKRELEIEMRDAALQLFFPGSGFLEPKIIGEADLKRELAELEEEE